ncbi:MAG: hypothetical protein KKB04_04320 [Candidatus Thermoplasmatota archaeon]|nr:hypothetical protein [Candidatus Thermoplasmatota archaeon]
MSKSWVISSYMGDTDVLKAPIGKLFISLATYYEVMYIGEKPMGKIKRKILDYNNYYG